MFKLLFVIVLIVIVNGVFGADGVSNTASEFMEWSQHGTDIFSGDYNNCNGGSAFINQFGNWNCICMGGETGPDCISVAGGLCNGDVCNGENCYTDGWSSFCQCGNGSERSDCGDGAAAPTAAPTNAPTAAPTNAPTAAPTNAPTTLKWQTDDLVPANIKNVLAKLNTVKTLGKAVAIDTSISLAEQATLWVRINQAIKLPSNGLEWGNKKKNAFKKKVLRIMNKRGTINLNIDKIMIKTIADVGTGERRLLSNGSSLCNYVIELEAFNDDEAAALLNDVADEPITVDEIVEEFNDPDDEDSAEFSDLTIDSSSADVEDADVEVTFPTYYDSSNEDMATYTPGDDIPDDAIIEITSAPTSANNADDPEGNGYEPTTKARIIGNVKRRRNPYEGDAKSVAEVQDIISDLITNNPKRKQWSVAKKVAFAKKIKKKYLKN